MIKTVFFDLDGTLFATEPDILAAYGKPCSVFGIPLSQVRIGPPFREAVRLAKPDLSDDEVEESLRLFMEAYVSSGYPGTFPYDGIPELLSALRERGIECVIATNKRLVPALAIVEKFGMTDIFSGLYTPECYPDEKLDKGMILTRLMRERGRSRSECVMVGDTELDIRAGRKASIRTVGVTWGYGRAGQPAVSCPDLLIDKPSQLLLWIDGENA